MPPTYETMQIAKVLDRPQGCTVFAEYFIILLDGSERFEESRGFVRN
jgi:hypothetical protein